MNQQHDLLINRAKSLGITVTDVSHLLAAPAAILDYKGITELVKDGVPESWVNVRSLIYCDNKQLTKLAYELLKLPYPKSCPFKTPDDAKLKAFFEATRADTKVYVCKPLDATHGLGVEINIRTWQDIEAYYTTYKHLDSLFMLEEQLEGEDLRFHVIEGKIVAACIREPAYVMGNGQEDLQTLIDQRRAVMQQQNAHNKLILDENSFALLKQQGLQLADVPSTNQKVQLKYVSNVAQGGVPIDVTDKIHPLYHEWVSQVADYLKTGYFGLDLMTTNYEAHPIGHSWILEINAHADWMHHTFSEVRTHDMAGIILQALFGKS